MVPLGFWVGCAGFFLVDGLRGVPYFFAVLDWVGTLLFSVRKCGRDPLLSIKKIESRFSGWKR
jgi:hypothetical protein